jgi:hypothetical protein
MSKRESPSALLIISAIDLLLASLVCGVILFVALVSARGQSSDEQTGNSPRARIPITVLYELDASTEGIKILNTEPAGPPVQASEESFIHSGFAIKPRQVRPAAAYISHGSFDNPFSDRLFAVPHRWASFTVHPNKKTITIQNITTAAYAAIHLGTQGSFYLWMRCEKPGWELELKLDSFRVLRDSCASRRDSPAFRPDETPPKPYLIVSDNVPGEEWEVVYALPRGNGMVSKWRETAKDVPLDVSTAVFKF